MNKALLDTDILSEVLKGIDPSVVGMAQRYRGQFGFLTTSSISVMEVVKGFHRADRESHRIRFVQTIGYEEILPFDFECSVPS